ncbi:MAG: magnesium/cobalt transporter CorA [Verrucomicrobiales bacterium]|nr:magnesium/cobalt transporter CorA [Verrucomicrobiales bacterium]
MKLPSIAKRHKGPGTTPGEAVYIGAESDRSYSIEAISYDEDTFKRSSFTKSEDIADFIQTTRKTWLHISGIHHTSEVEKLTDTIGLHRLSLEDILNTHHRPKVEFFEDHILVILKIIEAGEKNNTRQLAIVFMERRVVTFSECDLDYFTPIIKRIEKKAGRLRRFSSDYLAWAILDLVVDHYLIASESFEAELDGFDDKLLENSEEIDSTRLFKFKSEVNRLHRQFLPVREIIHHLRRSDSPVLSDESRPFFDDLYDHIVHAIEGAEQLREQATEIRDFYLATVNNRMNEVMKMLTCFSAIFLPLTFLVGVYGMNFDYMPELQWKWSYAVVWLLFIASTAFLLRLFRKRGWM